MSLAALSANPLKRNRRAEKVIMNACALKIGVASQNARRNLSVSLTTLLLMNLCSNCARN